MTIEELASKIIDVSLYWTGQDEERNPGLKKIRTLAGLILNKSDFSKRLCCSCGSIKWRTPADQPGVDKCEQCGIFYRKEQSQ
jgi:hypothetical protein